MVSSQKATIDRSIDVTTHYKNSVVNYTGQSEIFNSRKSFHEPSIEIFTKTQQPQKRKKQNKTMKRHFPLVVQIHSDNQWKCNTGQQYKGLSHAHTLSHRHSHKMLSVAHYSHSAVGGAGDPWEKKQTMRTVGVFTVPACFCTSCCFDGRRFKLTKTNCRRGRNLNRKLRIRQIFVLFFSSSLVSSLKMTVD